MWSSTYKIAINGAGPVGLVLANLLWELGYDVTLFEIRPEYTRNQIIILSSDIYRILLPEKVMTSLIKDNGCYVESVPRSANPVCITDPHSSEKVLLLFSIKLKELEKALYNYIKSTTSIKIIHETLSNDTPFNIIIGADGKDSEIRQKYFEEPLKYYWPENEWYACITTIKIPPEIIKKFIIAENTQFPLFPEFQFRARTLMQRDGLLTIAVAVHKSELDQKQKIIDTAMKIYGIHNLGKIIDQKTFPLNFYKAPRVSMIKNSKQYYLVGDSAANTHFFSGMGLNLGAYSALLLALDPENYQKNMKAIVSHAEAEVINQTMDLNLISERCASRGHEDLYTKLTKRGIAIKKEDIDKPELCIYLSVDLIPEKLRQLFQTDLWKKARKIPSRLNDYVAEKFIDAVCQNKEIPSTLQALFNRFIKYTRLEGSLVEGYSTHNPEYQQTLENIDTLSEPKPMTWQHNLWQAHKDFKSTNPVQKALDAIKKNHMYFGPTLHIEACLRLIEYKKDPTFNNFLRIYLLLPAE